MNPPIEAWGDAVRVMSPEQAMAIQRSGLLRVEPVAPPDRWRLIADSRVGIVAGPGWEERVVPRIAVPKLMFLLSYARDPDGWKDLLAPMAEEDDLFSAVAAGFGHHAQAALRRGPMRGYVSIDESEATIRGRLRVADQIARRGGLPIPVEVTHDEFTIDVQENRLVAAAARALLKLGLVPDAVRHRLRWVREVLADVQVPRHLELPPQTRLNAHYVPVLRLAELILRHLSIGVDRGPVSSSTFVFDMNKVFEDFVSTALAEALRPYGGVVEEQRSDHFLDAQRDLRLRPDIMWTVAGRVLAVFDAKYKRLDDRRFPHADAYQMLAYCTALRLPRGRLVYARDALERTRTHHLPNGIELHVHTIDVERQPADVLAQVEALARRAAEELEVSGSPAPVGAPG